MPNESAVKIIASSAQELSARTTAQPGRACLLQHARATPHRPISGTDSPRQIFRTSRFEISLCRGTVSTVPVAGFVQSECDRPSRFK